MNDIYFTSDTHFNHAKCCELFRPAFASLEEMNETMIERWNERVAKGDRVYHLGDFALGRAEDAAKIIDRLHGQIFLVKGNHDSVACNKLCRDKFVWIKDYHELRVGRQKICLSHYSQRTWNWSHYGSWHLYGHSHGSLPESDTEKSFDVGVDPWNFYPVSYNEVKEKMATKRYEPKDHHLLSKRA